MATFTTTPGYAATVLPEKVVRHLTPMEALDPTLEGLVRSLFAGGSQLLAAPQEVFPGGHLFLSEFSPTSQFDRVVELVRAGREVPHRTACLAGSGLDFHGFKGRPWSALPGNLHLVVHFAPNRPIDRFHVAFTALAALSVVEALDRVPELRARPCIKWVNDILLEGGKVAGVLAHTQSQGPHVTSAVLGIGLNVETTPAMEPTPFVPRVTSMREFLPHGWPDVQRRALSELLRALDRNYEILLSQGFDPLRERYRKRSVVVGRQVTVCTESSDFSLQVVAEGVVSGLGEGLELLLEGHGKPLIGGRLVLGSIPGDLAHRSPTPEDAYSVRSK